MTATVMPPTAAGATPPLRALAVAMGQSQAFYRARAAVAAGLRERVDQLDIACAKGAQPVLTAAIAQRPLLVVTATSRDAEDLTRALADLHDRDRVAVVEVGARAREVLALPCLLYTLPSPRACR